MAHNLGANTSMLMGAPCLRVDQESVVAAVPGDVHEADERSIAAACRHPPQAVWPDPLPPTSNGVAAVRLDEVDHLVVSHRPAPGVGDRIGQPRSLADGFVAWQALRSRSRMRRIREALALSHNAGSGPPVPPILRWLPVTVRSREPSGWR
jgi:hypothetical protein